MLVPRFSLGFTMLRTGTVVICYTFILSVFARICTHDFTVDITNGTYFDNSKIIQHNGINYTEMDYFEEESRIKGCICNVKPCVRKCCAENETFENKTCTFNERSKEFGQIYSNFAVVYKMLVCRGQRYRLQYEEYSINPSGDLLYLDQLPVSPESYCLEFIEPIESPYSLLCANEVASELEGQQYYSMGMIISMPFLVATFLVYALLPDRNLPAKSLMCYVLSLLFAYIMLVTIQLNGGLGPIPCNTIAFLCYFFFMASFFWMNSSCIDIWLTFSGIKGMTGQRTQERKRFIYYCLYSWGLPLIMTAIVIAMTYSPTNSKFDTGIGNGQCWFKSDLPTGIYFYFPIAALLITNITLFAVTALKIRNVQRDTKVLNAKDSSKHEKDKQRFYEYSEPAYLIEPVKNRGMQVYDFLDEDNNCLGFNLYVKLLFAMGVNWSMEVISWAVMWHNKDFPSYIFHLTDFCNAMYGVLIFFIFVFKKNIWLMLKKRYLQFMGRPAQAHSMGTSTHRTTVSQVTSTSEA